MKNPILHIMPSRQEKNIVFSIAAWDANHETTASKKLARVRWTPLPRLLGTREYRRIKQRPDGDAIIGVWSALLMLAAAMPVRGILADDRGPLSVEDIALEIGSTPRMVSVSLDALVKEGWIQANPEPGHGAIKLPRYHEYGHATLPYHHSEHHANMLAPLWGCSGEHGAIPQAYPSHPIAPSRYATAPCSPVDLAEICVPRWAVEAAKRKPETFDEETVIAILRGDQKAAVRARARKYSTSTSTEVKKEGGRENAIVAPPAIAELTPSPAAPEMPLAMTAPQAMPEPMTWSQAQPQPSPQPCATPAQPWHQPNREPGFYPQPPEPASEYRPAPEQDWQALLADGKLREAFAARVQIKMKAIETIRIEMNVSAEIFEAYLASRAARGFTTPKGAHITNYSWRYDLQNFARSWRENVAKDQEKASQRGGGGNGQKPERYRPYKAWVTMDWPDRAEKITGTREVLSIKSWWEKYGERYGAQLEESCRSAPNTIEARLVFRSA